MRMMIMKKTRKTITITRKPMIALSTHTARPANGLKQAMIDTPGRQQPLAPPALSSATTAPLLALVDALLQEPVAPPEYSNGTRTTQANYNTTGRGRDMHARTVVRPAIPSLL
jgi:hypothetical protein